MALSVILIKVTLVIIHRLEITKKIMKYHKSVSRKYIYMFFIQIVFLLLITFKYTNANTSGRMRSIYHHSIIHKPKRMGHHQTDLTHIE